MSITSRPIVARSVARLLQASTKAAGGRMARTARARLPEFSARTRTLEIPTSVGPAAVTVYEPDQPDGAAVHVNFHGGGYVLEIAVEDDALCRAVASLSGSVVLNVDYVVAPGHPFPGPTRQAFEVVRWVAAHGREQGWDPSRLTVGGQSAGGALAAAVARQSLEEGGPAIALQVLHYPPLDLTVPAWQKRSPLAKPVLRPWMGDVFDSSYATDAAARRDRLVSPAGSADTADLTGIAPAVVIAAENDILRDEDGRYADRLASHGALVAFRVVAGGDHGYDLKDDPRAREIYPWIAEHVAVAAAPGIA